MKKFLSTALALSLVVSASAALAMEGVEVDTNEDVMAITSETPESETPIFGGNTGVISVNGQEIRINALNKLALNYEFGTVSFFGDENPRIMLNGVNEEGETYGKIILNTSAETTRVIDAETGMPATLEDIEEGDVVYAYTSPMMAMSMPPQSSAELLIINASESTIIPVYAEINDIVRNEETGNVTLITDRAVNITLTEETEVSPYLTRQNLTKDTLSIGQKILAWYPIQTLSYPAQATATKLVGFNSEYTGTIGLSSDSVLTINGEAIRFDRLAMPRVEGDSYLLPMRKVVELLGCTVTWQQESNSVVVSHADGTEMYNFVLGSEEVTVDGDMVTYLNHTVDTAFGITYLDINDIISLHDLKFVG